MNNDLISRKALLEEINKWPESVMYKDWVQSAIVSAPTIDAVPVVRCEECQCRGEADDCPLLFYNRAMLDEHNTDDNDFCSYGERKEPENG